jgi:hypothetical protein
MCPALQSNSQEASNDVIRDSEEIDDDYHETNDDDDDVTVINNFIQY